MSDQGAQYDEDSWLAINFRLREQVAAVRALAEEWASHAEDSRAYAAARILDALDGGVA